MREAELEQAREKQAAAEIQNIKRLDLFRWSAFLKPQLLAYLKTADDFSFDNRNTSNTVIDKNPILGAMLRDLARFSDQDTPEYMYRGDDPDTEDMGEIGHSWAGLFMATARPLQELILVMAYAKDDGLPASRLIFAAYGEGDHAEEKSQLDLLAKDTLLITKESLKAKSKNTPRYVLDKTVREAIVTKLLETKASQDNEVLDAVIISRLGKENINPAIIKADSK
jgi:hypothetical protein